MKKYALILMVCACIAACGKKGGPAPVVPPPAFVDSPYITATINNTSFSTGSAIAQAVLYPNDSGRQDISVQSVQTINGVGYQLNFYITNFTGINTYNISPPQVSATCYINGARHFAQSGQFVVATYDSNSVLTGTFNFVADSITITNGVFNLAL